MKVLVADDTKNIRTLLMKCLQMEGCDVSTSADGREALEALLVGSFDLAFLDIKMPLLSGTEVLRKIREAGVNTPVIIITAYATVKNAVECTQMGAVAYLQKPFTAEKVRNVLYELQQQKVLSGGKAEDAASVEKLIKEGKLSEALRLLRLELAQNPLDPGVYLLLSRVSEGLGHTEDARKYRRIYDSIL